MGSAVPEALAAPEADAPRPAAAGRETSEPVDRQASSGSTGADNAQPQAFPSAAVVDAPPPVQVQDVPGQSSGLGSGTTAETAPDALAAPPAVVSLPTPGPSAASTVPDQTASDNGGCSACWGAKAPTIGQAVTTVINHLFNSTFDWVSTLPANPFSNLLEGTLVLVRRSLFLIPDGVTAQVSNNELTVTVGTGSVAYVRQNGIYVEVSGDPSFQGSDRFKVDSVHDVVVSNPGNAGCAGFVLESGTVAASLETNDIDQIRFGSGAAFGEKVSATVTGGPLTLRDAVRGLTGVDIDAAVVLGNNVEVDAGNGDAIFRGTVDAAKSGQQSLTVTALGTTRFSAPVGGQAALESLLTRGITPLTINQNADTKTIALHYAPEVQTNGKVQIKYGIDAAIGNNPSQLYEFDTGGNSFFAGYNPPFWANVPLTTDAITVAFTSGNTFDSVVANGTVTLGSGAQTVSTDRPIRVGAILSGSNPKKGEQFVFTNPDAPPVDGNFFGDFGASFDVFNVKQTGQSMASPLLQLPGNLSTGFLVRLGPIGNTDPQLTVGVTDSLRDQFPYAIPVSAATPPATYPVSGYPVLDLFGFAPQYFAQDGDGAKIPIGTESACIGAQCLPTVIDSGAPSTGIRLNGEKGPFELDGGQLAPGVKLIAQFPTVENREPLTWTLTAGDTPSVDYVQYQKSSVADTNQNVNTGLNLYNTFDVMFDAQKGVIWLRPNDGAATVIAGSVTTTGDQIYKQNAQLGGTYTTGGGAFTVGGGTELVDNTVVDAGSGDVSFHGAIDGTTAGSQTLTVNSSGTTAFTRGIGEQVPLNSITTDAGGRTATAGVSTVGDQRYDDDVSLSGSYSLTNGSFLAARDATLTGAVTITNSSPGRDITFAGRIDGSQTRGYTLSLAANGGSIELDGDVGASRPLGGLSVDAVPVPAGSATTFSARGAINLNGGLGNAPKTGLSIGTKLPDNPTGISSLVANAAHGGVIGGFSENGVIIGSANGGPTTGVVTGQISGFAISNNGKDGVSTRNTSGLTLADNVILGNGSDGLRSTTDTGLTVTSTTVTGNGAEGIRATGDTAVTVINNTVKGNVAGGLLSTGGTGLTVTGNTFEGNGTAANTAPGIELAGSKKSLIADNTIIGNAGSGILSTEQDGKDSVDAGNTISGNTISGNARDGVTVDNNSIGNAILSNAIFSNGTADKKFIGISLQNGGNDDQPAPERVSAQFLPIVAPGVVIVRGHLTSYSTDYTGTYQIQVFVSPPSDAPNVQGRQLLGTHNDVPAGDFSFAVSAASPGVVGSLITLTATPSAGPANTSEFSEYAVITT